MNMYTNIILFLELPKPFFLSFRNSSPFRRYETLTHSTFLNEPILGSKQSSPYIRSSSTSDCTPIIMKPFTENTILDVFEWKTENAVILSRKELPLPSINEMPDYFKPREDGEKY